MNSTTQHAAATASQRVPDITGVRSRMKATWEDGDYADFARYMEAGAVEIFNGWDIKPGSRLLDIGCGSGQTAIPAARRGHRVTGVDIAENLIACARERAAEENLAVRFDVGDAEALPCETNGFDTVITMIGAMFAPRPEQVVLEMARVIRPGGQLFMANWTPGSMPAQMFKCISTYMPPPPGCVSPVLWGDEDSAKNRLGAGFTDIKLTRKCYPQWHYPFGPAELVELFRTRFGPVKRAFSAVDERRHSALRQELEDIYTANGERHGKCFTITGGEYLEVIATRRQ